MKRVGLALSSGGPRGLAHVGVLQALTEAGVPVGAVAGTSVGAYVGGLFAAGVPLQHIAKLWNQMGLAQAARMLLPTFPWRGWTEGKELARVIEDLVGDQEIQDLPIPFAAVACDLSTGQPVALSRGSLAKAVRASLSVPGLLVPAQLGGRTFIDGGVVHPLPIDVVRRLGAEVVVAVDVLVAPEQDPTAAGDVFTVLFRMATIFQKRLADLALELLKPEVLIRPDFRAAPPTYTDPGCGLEAGYRAAQRALPTILNLCA